MRPGRAVGCAVSVAVGFSGRAASAAAGMSGEDVEVCVSQVIVADLPQGHQGIVQGARLVVAAPSGSEGAGVGILAFEDVNDIEQGDLGRVAGQTVAAAGARVTADQTGLGEDGENLRDHGLGEVARAGDLDGRGSMAGIVVEQFGQSAHGGDRVLGSLVLADHGQVPAGEPSGSAGTDHSGGLTK